MGFYTETIDKGVRCLILFVKIKPQARIDSINETIEISEQTYLKVSIKSPPVDGKANKHLIEFLAKTFKVTKSEVIITHGTSSKFKRLEIRNYDSTAIEILKQIHTN